MDNFLYISCINKTYHRSGNACVFMSWCYVEWGYDRWPMMHPEYMLKFAAFKATMVIRRFGTQLLVKYCRAIKNWQICCRSKEWRNDPSDIFWNGVMFACFSCSLSCRHFRRAILRNYWLASCENVQTASVVESQITDFFTTKFPNIWHYIHACVLVCV